MKFGERLARARKEKNITQEQLAELLGVSRQSVSRWESELAYPETEKLIELSRCLDTSIDYLLRGENGEKGSSFYDDVKAVGQRLASDKSKRRLKKGLRLALMIGGIILAVDLLSMILWFLVVGIPG